MSNKRKNKRFFCTVPVEGKEGSEFDQTQTVDFCKNGFGFITNQRVPVNKEIAVEIDLNEDSHSVLVIGKVKWVKKSRDKESEYRVGMVFADILRGSKYKLNNYFRKASAASYI